MTRCMNQEPSAAEPQLGHSELASSIPSNDSSIVAFAFFTVVDVLAELCDVDRTQIVVGATLLLFISFNIFLTSVAWNRYSKTIVVFFEEERKQKLREEKEFKED